MLRSACVVVLLALARGALAQDEPAPSGPLPRIALFSTQVIGVDPIVGRFVDRALRRRAEALGYSPLDPEQGRLALEELRAAAPPSPEDLWRATERLQAERGAHAVAWASGGRYVVQVRVARPDRQGAFTAQADAGQVDLEATVERVLAEALLAAAQSAEGPVAPAPATKPEAPPGPRTSDSESGSGSGSAGPEAGPGRHAWRIALHNDVAFGLADDPFVNDVAGVRLDLGFGGGLWLGAHLGYANLKGRSGRVHGVLPYGQIEQRIALGAGRAPSLPLRIALGYLARNGGFLRLSSGLAVPLGERVEIGFDVLAPAFWVTPDKTLFSFDLGFELAVEL